MRYRKWRAVYAGNDGKIIARRDAAIGAHNSLKRGALPLGDKIGGLCVGAEIIIALKLGKNEIMFMHMFARCDIASGEADNLAIFPHLQVLILGDDRSGDFVAERNCVGHV